MATLNRKLSLSFIIPLLIISIMAIGGLVVSNRSNISNVNLALFDSILEGSSNYIGNWVNHSSRSVEQYAALVEDPVLKIESLGNFSLAGTMTHASGSMLAYFADENDGRLYMAEGTEELFKSGFDPRKRAWYTSAVAKSDRANFSDPYIDVITGQLIVTVAKRAKGGVVGADFSTKDLVNVINGLKIPGGGYAVVTYGDNNQILAYSDPKFITKSLETIDKNLNKNVVGDIFNATAKHYPFEIQLSNGNSMVAMGILIPNSTWKLMVFIDRDYFYGTFVSTLAMFIIFTVLIATLSYFGITYYTSHKIVKPIEAVSEHLRKMADGEIRLTDKLDISTGDEIELMNNSMNNFIDRQYTNILKLSDKVRESVNLASDNNKLISYEIDTQKTNVTGVVDIIKGIHDVTHQIMDVTNHTIEGIDHIRDKSNNGLALVGETESAMRGLSSSISSTQEAVTGVARHTEEIARLSENIKTIAEQTNLLALNAAIESARAGEHGRGFAVVADEVRSLAIKTRESTEQIQKTVEALIVNMKSTLDKVNESTEECTLTIERNKEAVAFLSDIIHQIESTSDGARQITNYAQEQSHLIATADGQIERINSAQVDIQSAVESISNSTKEMEHSSEEIIKELLQN